MDGKPVDQKTLKSKLGKSTTSLDREKMLLEYAERINEERSELYQELELVRAEREELEQKYRRKEAELERIKERLRRAIEEQEHLHFAPWYGKEEIISDIQSRVSDNDSLSIVLIELHDYLSAYDELGREKCEPILEKVYSKLMDFRVEGELFYQKRFQSEEREPCPPGRFICASHQQIEREDKDSLAYRLQAEINAVLDSTDLSARVIASSFSGRQANIGAAIDALMEARKEAKQTPDQVYVFSVN